VSALGFIESVQGYFKTAWNYLEPAIIFPVVTLIFLTLFFLYYRRITKPLAGTVEWVANETARKSLTFFTHRFPMEKRDIGPLAIITAVFSFLALFKLGDTSAPQSFFQFNNQNDHVTIELYKPEEISKIMFYTGLWTGGYTVEFSVDGIQWTALRPIENADASPSPVMNQPHSHLFKWRYAEYESVEFIAKYIRITEILSTPTNKYAPLELGELALYDSTGALINGSRIINPGARELFDEQELVPKKPEYMNSMYFDEIYHGRTALEHLRNIFPYEITHPPLGKEIIAASIYAFGMTPFGWRFIGAVFGVAMLVIMYIFLKNMFGKTVVAICGTLLFGFDFMRFVQTRIATIDTYGVIFILLSFFFMYRHITTDPDAPFKKSLAPLALSGISFGLGCASKWIVPYAGIGLAIIYAIRLVMLAKHYNENEKPGYGLYLIKTLLFSALFFIVVPIMIYCLSYIPYGLARNMRIKDGMLLDKEYYKIIWDNQVYMLKYHSKDVLNSEHPYSSRWYQWIVDGRPILYFREYNGDLRSAFAAFGNPVVWWGGFIAMVAMAIRIVRQRDGKSLFILIGYLSQLLPWVAISRIVFAYHYFPSTLFLVIALAHVFNTIFERRRGVYKQAVISFTALAGVVFALFYPALTGVYAPNWYFTYFLRWIPGAWPF